MVDTGAGITCVDESVLRGLDLMPVGITSIATPVGRDMRNSYRVRFELPDVELDLEHKVVTAIDLTGLRGRAAHMGHPVIALIGRDVLALCVFTYDGPNTSFSISIPSS